jgi:hypothetical protein
MIMRFSPLESLGIEQETFPQPVRRAQVPGPAPYPDVSSVCAAAVWSARKWNSFIEAPTAMSGLFSRTWQLRVFP